MNKLLLRSTIATLAAASLILAAPLAEAAAASRLSNIQTKGGTDITDRTTSLAELTTKVQAASKLTSDQKSGLVSEMQAETTGLNTLKTKLDGETTVTAALTDFSNIFKEHYIYAFYLPRVERIIGADAESDAATNLTNLASTLEDYITAAETAGNTVDSLNTKLSELKAKAADAQVQAQTVITSLLPLKASDYPGNKSSLTTATTTLKTGRTDLQTARTDAKSIVASLKTMLKK